MNELIGNYVLIAAVSAWALAQVLKAAFIFIKNGELDIRRMFFASGGMPSSHSAAVAALAMATARTEGLGSPLFAVVVIFALLVMYDAVGVRWAAGQQARILNHLINGMPKHKPEYMQEDLKEKIGHKPLEVIAGALLGLLVALAVAPW